MKKKIIIAILFAIVCFAANAVVPDSIKRNLEDFDYLTNFTEKNYTAFPAIMEQGYQKKYETHHVFGKNGIEPDVRITLPYPKLLTDNIDEWVLWVAEDLKTNKTN